MKIGSRAWMEMVTQGAAQLGIDLDATRVRAFARHAALLMEWNRTLNLTAIVDPTQVAVKHVLDAIAPLNRIPDRGRLLDIGTGGGFPGIPLKIMRPHQPMTLIDAVRKKVNFVKHVIRELALPAIEAHHVRVESMGREPSADGFDVIVCRALSNLQQVVQWAGPLLADGGCIVAYCGPQESASSHGPAAPAALTFRQTTFAVDYHAYDLPILGDHRSVAVIQANR